MSAAGQTSHDLPSVQVHLCGGSQNRFHERASYSREGNQAAHELVRDQETDGKLLGCPRGGRKDRIMEWLYPMLPAEQRKERGRRQFESYFKFGFVRNPWDRVVSLYERNEAVQMRQQMSFEEFARWIQYSSSTCVQFLAPSLPA